ncbi:DUF4870 domain-containing protein [Leifsonia sp. NPDC058248]|uniref:DUF4870 domain-containing protein n=1 Tax=Leifsonia sp. NPDC058248 TaxID=3346402 RepID=UPI0036D7E534
MSDQNQPPIDPNSGGVPPQQPPQPPQQPQQPYAAPAAPLDPAQDKQWASFAHLGGILWILPSLIIFLVFKDRGQLTRQESKEALNWQITWLIVWLVSYILGIALILTPVGWVFLTLIPWILYVVNLVFSILGFVRVNSGGTYRYPVNFRFIK